jgi:hypothetical protein
MYDSLGIGDYSPKLIEKTVDAVTLVLETSTVILLNVDNYNSGYALI